MKWLGASGAVFAGLMLAQRASATTRRRPLGLDVREKGMAEMSEKFKKLGNEVYVDADAVKESNKVL